MDKGPGPGSNYYHHWFFHGYIDCAGNIAVLSRGNDCEEKSYNGCALVAGDQQYHFFGYPISLYNQYKCSKL
jgi:hypothetical protein